MNDCIFCKIINGEIPSYKIYENEHTLAFLDISQDCFGHTLVIPKKHYENIFDTNETILSEVIKTVKLISNHFKNLGFDGVNILNNNDKSAEQSIMHLHFHIIPRKDNDKLKVFPTLGGDKTNLSEVQKNLSIKY